MTVARGRSEQPHRTAPSSTPRLRPALVYVPSAKRTRPSFPRAVRPWSSLHPWRSRSKLLPVAPRRAQWLATPVQPRERAHARRDSSAELHGSSAPVAEHHSSQARSTQERVRWGPPPELTEQAQAP